MNRKSLVGYFVLFFLVLIMSQSVLSLGVTPARETFDFEPGSIHEVKFSLVNNENRDMDIVVYAEGGLVDSVVLGSSMISFLSTDESKSVSYFFTMPDKLEPGITETMIVAKELPKTNAFKGAEVSSVVSVVHQLHVMVPYPGKYATAEIKIAETGRTDVVDFIIPVNNLGVQNIANANGVIDIYDPLDEKITSISTTELGISSGEKGELTAVWLENVKPGRYYAKLTVFYDEKVTSEIEKVFIVGGVELNVLDILVNEDFKLGDIAKFNILVESDWSENIDGVFAEMVVYTVNDEEVIRFKSSTESVGPFGRQEVIAYWDTNGIKEGIYKTTLILHYGGKSSEIELGTAISLTSIEFSGLELTGEVVYGEGKISKTTVLTVLVIVLVIGNLLWFVYFKRKKKRKI